MSKLSESQIRKAISESSTKHEAILKLDSNASGSFYQFLNRCIKKYDIDISHFLSHKEIIKRQFANGKLVTYSNEFIFKKDTKIGRHVAKKRILRDKLIPYKCILCGQNTKWKNKELVLILDHIDGDRFNNEITNLRFVCPNCNSTLDTHCLGMNKLSKKRAKVDKRTKVYHKLITGSEYVPNIKIRKVERPSKENLKKLLETNTWTGIGRLYGVSDNAVRKWAKTYQII